MALLDGLWVGWPPDGADLEKWARDCVTDWSTGWSREGSTLGPALIVDDDEPFVGIISLVPHSSTTVELLYGVLPTARLRSVASRAVTLVAEWALTDGPYRRVELRIGESHLASQRVAEKAGFRFVESYETYVTGTGQTHVDFLYVRAQ